MNTNTKRGTKSLGKLAAIVVSIFTLANSTADDLKISKLELSVPEVNSFGNTNYFDYITITNTIPGNFYVARRADLIGFGNNIEYQFREVSQTELADTNSLVLKADPSTNNQAYYKIEEISGE